KIRLAAERPAAKHQLRVDTREPVMNSYNNTVEVLSPNPPSEHTIEDQSFRTTKDDLLQQISKVDREMALSETTLQKLKKKQEELEQSASKPALTEEPEEAPPRHRSLAQCIYADNRKRAAAAHAVLAHLGPPVLYPLYNQPEDTAVYHENIRKHRAFRRRLADHLKTVRLETEKREDALTEEYSRRAAEWLRRVDRIEQGQKRKTKDARNREFFEKVFPELRKAREERERFNRLGARVKSEAELEEIADGLHEQEHEDKKMRSLTVVPPLLRDPRLTRHNLDTNKRCMDMETEYKELKLRNVWTRAEKEMFREKYLQHPKNFGQIASFLPRKSVRDCVRFYYLSKKAENYKQLLRKPRPRRHARPRPAPEPELPAGVTTRLQRIQGEHIPPVSSR
ncbi:jg1170, partial [Pararge aegeria aegeria]